jgi:glycosyltransferase involved in cell wall biosynthesis
MFSIITAIHNQLRYTQVFLESLKKYTYHPYELIIVDNNSTDGSAEYCEGIGAKVIRNQKNFCYPCSQNIGMREAKYDYLCFINNDVYVGVNWDKYLIEALERYNLDAVSPSGIEKMESYRSTREFMRRWKRIGRYKHRHKDKEGLKKLVVRMYGDWEEFCRKRYEDFFPEVVDGINGNCIMAKRELFQKIGRWDEKMQAADWNFYLTLRQREEEMHDVTRVKIVCWAFVHHFIRATQSNKPAPFACNHPRLSTEEKWGEEAIRRYWPGPIKRSLIRRLIRRVRLGKANR